MYIMTAQDNPVGDAVQALLDRLQEHIVQFNPVAGSPRLIHEANCGVTGESAFHHHGLALRDGDATLTNRRSTCPASGTAWISGRNPTRYLVRVNDAYAAETARPR